MFGPFPPSESDNHYALFLMFKDLVYDLDQCVLNLTEEIAIEITGLIHNPMVDWDKEQALAMFTNAFDHECKHALKTSQKERTKYVKDQLRRGGGTMFKSIAKEDKEF